MKLFELRNPTEFHTPREYYYVSAIVRAETEEEARLIHPYDDYVWNEENGYWEHQGEGSCDSSWCSPSQVWVSFIGEATGPWDNGSQVVIASREYVF